VAGLNAIDGVQSKFSGSCFHEAVIELDRPVAPVLEALSDAGIVGGFDMSQAYPELGNCLLVCATETKTDDDIDSYLTSLRKVLA
ncbi:MAG: glycine dehydrogenase, partial [Pseudomonadota bacterium]